MIPFAYNLPEDSDDIDDELEDILDNIVTNESPSSHLVFTMDVEQPYAHFHMITDKIAIGDYRTPYDDFDVIFNFNCPYNGAPVGVINIEMDYDSGSIQKTLYNVG